MSNFGVYHGRVSVMMVLHPTDLKLFHYDYVLSGRESITTKDTLGHCSVNGLIIQHTMTSPPFIAYPFFPLPHLTQTPSINILTTINQRNRTRLDQIPPNLHQGGSLNPNCLFKAKTCAHATTRMKRFVNGLSNTSDTFVQRR
jgi:hypothetical protein